MKNKIQYNGFKEVSLHHLRVKVIFFDLSELKGVPHGGYGYTCILGDEKEDGSIDIGVFYKDIKRITKKLECAPLVGHELVHVLQILCEERKMKAETEQEHLAYIFGYLFEQLIAPKDKEQR